MKQMKRLCNQPHMNYVLPEGNYHVAADYEKYFCIVRINEVDDSARKGQYYELKGNFNISWMKKKWWHFLNVF